MDPMSSAGSSTAAGMAVFVVARQELGRNWSQTVSTKQPQELVTAGPYRVVRHKLLTHEFPTQYPGYMQHTRALIPFVW